MRGRPVAMMVALASAGCDKLFDLRHVPASDGANNGSDASGADAPIPTCASTLLADAFDDNVIDRGVWFDWADSGASTTEANQQIVLDLGTGAVEDGRQAELVTRAGFDVRGRRITVEVPLISNVDTRLQATLFVRAEPSTDGFAFAASQGNVYCVQRVAGEFTTLATLTYDAIAYRFWQLREVSGRVYYAASADGILWHDLVDTPVQIAVTDLKIGIYVYMDGTEVDPGYATFDNFGMCDLID